MKKNELYVYLHQDDEGIMAIMDRKRYPIQEPDMIMTYAQLQAIYKKMRDEYKIFKAADKAMEKQRKKNINEKKLKIQNMSQAIFEMTDEERYELLMELKQYINLDPNEGV